MVRISTNPTVNVRVSKIINFQGIEMIGLSEFLPTPLYHVSVSKIFNLQITEIIG